MVLGGENNPPRTRILQRRNPLLRILIARVKGGRRSLAIPPLLTCKSCHPIVDESIEAHLLNRLLLPVRDNGNILIEFIHDNSILPDDDIIIKSHSHPFLK